MTEDWSRLVCLCCHWVMMTTMIPVIQCPSLMWIQPLRHDIQHHWSHQCSSSGLCCSCWKFAVQLHIICDCWNHCFSLTFHVNLSHDTRLFYAVICKCYYTVDVCSCWYRETLDRSPWLLSVQIVLTPGLYPGPGIYAGPGFYQIISKLLIFAAAALAYGSYCTRLALLVVTASEKYLMPVTHKWRHPMCLHTKHDMICSGL